MTKCLVATLGVGKGTWGHVARLIADEKFDKIVLVATEWVKENFVPKQECEWILINNRAGFEVIKEEIKSKVPKGDLSLSLVSGSGKEHMALIAALKESKQSFQLVLLTGDGIKYY